MSRPAERHCCDGQCAQGRACPAIAHPTTADPARPPDCQSRRTRARLFFARLAALLTRGKA